MKKLHAAILLAAIAAGYAASGLALRGTGSAGVWIFNLAWLALGAFLVGRRQPIFDKNRLGGQLLRGVCLAAGCAAAAGIAVYIAGGDLNLLGFIAYPLPQAVSFVLFQAVVAVQEELVFRGELDFLLASFKLPPLLTAALSGAAFGGVHYLFGGSIFQLCVTAAVGGVFSWCRLKNRSCTFLSLMTAHFIYDLLLAK